MKTVNDPIKLTPYPSLLRIEGAKCFSPSHREEKERIAMPRLCEASGDAIPQSGGPGDELVIRVITVHLYFAHWNLVLVIWIFS